MAKEYVGNYELIKPWDDSAANGAYTFAKKKVNDGQIYFLKRYRDPVYPRESIKTIPNGLAKFNAQKERFERYKKHMEKMNDNLKKVAVSGANLVITEEFFKEGSFLYKTTLKVDSVKNSKGEDYSMKEVSKLPFDSVKSIMYTMCSALTSLHRSKIVHGDIKFDNVLITKGSMSGKFISKLIDFDSSYFEGELFSPEETLGTPEYYSPELYEYITLENDARKEMRKKLGRKLTPEEIKDIKDGLKPKIDSFKTKIKTSSDIFAVGIVLYEMAFGKRIEYTEDAEVDGPGCALVFGLEIKYPKDINPDFKSLLASMLDKDFNKRPDIVEVSNKINALKSFHKVKEEIIEEEKPLLKKGTVIIEHEKFKEFGVQNIYVRKIPSGHKIYDVNKLNGTKIHAGEFIVRSIFDDEELISFIINFKGKPVVQNRQTIRKVVEVKPEEPKKQTKPKTPKKPVEKEPVKTENKVNVEKVVPVGNIIKDPRLTERFGIDFISFKITATGGRLYEINYQDGRKTKGGSSILNCLEDLKSIIE